MSHCVSLPQESLSPRHQTQDPAFIPLSVHQHQRKLSTIILTEFDGTDAFIKEEESGCSSIIDNYDLNKIHLQCYVV